MPLTWDQSLATGSSKIDQQHRKLFAHVSALADAMKQGKGRHEIDAMLDFPGRQFQIMSGLRFSVRGWTRIHVPSEACKRQN
jgi:hypothetical protein